jgi:hypothetical protein
MAHLYVPAKRTVSFVSVLEMSFAVALVDGYADALEA